MFFPLTVAVGEVVALLGVWGKLWGAIAKPSCLLIKITARQFTALDCHSFILRKAENKKGVQGTDGCGQMVDWRRSLCAC